LNTARDKLSWTVLAPIKGIAGTKRLVIIPDGALEYIPFAALVDPDSKQPLVVSHELAILPSLSVLWEIRDEFSNRPSAPKTLAVLADPVVEEHDPRLIQERTATVPRSRLPAVSVNRGLSVWDGVRNPFDTSTGVDEAVNFVRLPFAAEEAEMLMKLVPESERLVATGFDANRQMASSEALSDFRMIHFATHGLLDFKHPRLSCLVLSRFDQKGVPQDGYFRLQDVYSMKLSADLVVLSACQTALGKQIRGEGLVGLTRGFFYAGAARVAASLWNVDDNASAKLMERFYRKMLGPEKMPPAAALRAAQIEMMREKRWEDPYYWAAFVLQGEWK
jgi:CHAT domain-containing protein